MKRVLLTILFLYLASLGYGQDVKYVSFWGNDGSGDGSQGNPWLTLGMAVSDGQAAGDTVVVHGFESSETFVEQLAPAADGTAGSKIVWIDSLRYADGINSTKPDTFWTAVIDPGTFRCIQLSGDDFHDFIGFNFLDPTLYAIDINNADGNKFWQCKLSKIDANNSSVFMLWQQNASVNDTLISCLVLTTKDVRFGIGSDGSANSLVVLNSTIYMSATNWSSFLSQATSGASITLKNNIIQNYSTTSGDWAIAIDDVAGVADFNNNIFEGAGGDGNWFRFNGQTGSTIAAWEDSVNNYDADGATNSLNTDPSIQNPTTTAFILNTSPAAEAGVDLGYGNDIGYYQTDPAAPSATPATKPKGKPWFFGENYIESNDSLYVNLDKLKVRIP